MKKIIAAFDGLKYSDSTEKYAMDFAKKYIVKVHGVFLEDFTYHSYKITDMIGGDDVDTIKAESLRRSDIETRENAIKHFHQHFSEANLVHATHRDRNIAIQELIHESLFADLIIIQNNETLTHYSEEAPTNFITELLERTECPVLVVPPQYRKPEKIVFLYDGAPSSVYAIKLFAYLFPDEDLCTELVSVTAKEKVIPDSFLLREWLKLNYPDNSYKTLPGDPDEAILHYLREQVENTLVVLGSYGRGTLSRMLHKSVADILMKNLDIPLFIAHK